MVSAGSKLNVPGCTRSKLTVWDEFKVTSKEAAGIANREKRLEERRTKLRPHLKPGNYAAVQARERWSTAEDVHLRPGHHWVFELGDAGGGKGCFEKTFKLARRTWEMYKVSSPGPSPSPEPQPAPSLSLAQGTRFDDGDQAVVVRRWLHRDPSDASGITFVEWDPAKGADPEAPPVPMIVNSSEVRSNAGFKLKELMPAQLDSSARASRRTRGAGVRTMEGMGEKRLICDNGCQ